VPGTASTVDSRINHASRGIARNIHPRQRDPEEDLGIRVILAGPMVRKISCEGWKDPRIQPSHIHGRDNVRVNGEIR